ncbi:MAG: ABC transporter substrate-binding protein [Clostridium sp.]
MKLKKIFSITLALIMGTSLIACNNSGYKDKKDHDKALQEIDVVLDWYPNAVHSFIYTAIEKGYFSDEGLKVNLKFPSNPTDPLALPAAGKADFGMYYLQDVVMARVNEKIPVKSVGAIVQSPLNIVLSLKENNITTPKDLVNKTVGYSSNPLSEELIKTMLTDNNEDPNSVNLIDVGFELMSSMTTKQVDATIGALVNHEVPVMKKEGHDVNYFSPVDFGVPNYYELVFVTNEKTDSNLSERFLKGCKKGFDYTKNNPKDALKILLDNEEKANFPLTESVEKESLDMLLPLMETDSSKFLNQEESVWQENINWLKEKGLIKSSIDAKDVFTNVLN